MPELITRKEAYVKGRIRFYNGKPCKQGHLSERYVSTGACIQCQNPYKMRLHPLRRDLEPYVCPKLWVPVGTRPGDFEELERYLQSCIDVFFKHKRSQVEDLAAILAKEGIT